MVPLHLSSIARTSWREERRPRPPLARGDGPRPSCRRQRQPPSRSTRTHGRGVSLTGAKLLAGLSSLGFVVGLYFPLMVLLDPGPSVTAYGIVLVSFPAWGVGVVSGGLAAYLAGRPEGRASRLARFSRWVGGLNLLALLLCLIWSPAGVS